MLKCRTCHGTYPALQADGTEYYHACPPLSAAELGAALTAGTVALTPEQQATVTAARQQDQARPPAADQPSREQLALAACAIERPNRRDENVTDRKDTKGRALIKAAGGGVDVVP